MFRSEERFGALSTLAESVGRVLERADSTAELRLLDEEIG
jgi:hypothetical protein